MAIIVATDFADSSRNAILLGALLARRRRVPLIIVHAVEAAGLRVPMIPIGISEWESQMVLSARDSMAHATEEVKQLGIELQTEVHVGSPVHVIRQIATANTAELIVVGRNGRKGGHRFVLGSIAEAIVRSSGCPVLVVKEGDVDVRRWEGTEPLRLVVGVDASGASEAALAWLGSFKQRHGCAPSIVRLYWPPDEALRYGLDDLWEDPQKEGEVVSLMGRDVRRLLTELVGPEPLPLRFRVAGRDAAEVLAEEASENADALVVGIPRERPSRWNVTAPAPILRRSRLPVFCIPESAAPGRERVPLVRSLLVAADMSESCRDVVAMAYGLLQATGGRVTLCHVHVAGGVAALGALPPPLPLAPDQKTALEARLRALVPPEAKEWRITTGVSIIEGRLPAEGILSSAERLAVDAIVIGSHGRSGWRRAILGSVSDEVVRHASRPLVLVPTPQGVRT